MSKGLSLVCLLSFSFELVLTASSLNLVFLETRFIEALFSLLIISKRADSNCHLAFL